MEGQAWPYVMFVVQGAVNLERYNLEVCDGGQVGAGACRARRRRPPGSSTPHSSRRRTGARRSATPRRGRLPY